MKPLSQSRRIPSPRERRRHEQELRELEEWARREPESDELPWDDPEDAQEPEPAPEQQTKRVTRIPVLFRGTRPFVVLTAVR